MVKFKILVNVVRVVTLSKALAGACAVDFLPHTPTALSTFFLTSAAASWNNIMLEHSLLSLANCHLTMVILIKSSFSHLLNDRKQTN